MQIAYVKGIKYVLRLSTRQYRCARCKALIHYRQEFIQRTEISKSTSKPIHNAICKECYVGPKLEKHFKAYKWGRKWYPAMKAQDELRLILRCSAAKAIPIELPEGSAIKFAAHSGYDKLLCEHVFHGFCQQCSQYKCNKRRL